MEATIFLPILAIILMSISIGLELQQGGRKSKIIAALCLIAVNIVLIVFLLK